MGQGNSRGIITPSVNTGSIISFFSTEIPHNASAVTVSTPIPLDNTIPQITEGAQVCTLVVTPKRADSKLRFTFTANIQEVSNSANSLTTALFNTSDGSTDAKCVMVSPFGGSTDALNTSSIPLIAILDSHGTASHTYSIRASTDAAVNIYVNRGAINNTELYGTSLKSYFICEEISPDEVTLNSTPKATDAEVTAGTNDTKYVSPLKLKTYIDNRTRYAKIAVVKSNGVGGGTATSGSYTKRTGFSVITDTTNLVSLASDVFTLAAGAYLIKAHTTFFATARARIKWRNTTDSIDIRGSSTYSNTAADSKSFIEDQFTITTSKNFEIQYYCQTTSSTEDLGVATADGGAELYDVVELWKVS